MLVWNVQGLRDSKTQLYDLADYFHSFDIILWSKTVLTAAPALFVDYSVADVPALRHALAGDGLLLAVRHSDRYHVEDHTSDASALWGRLCPTATRNLNLLGVCYLPPAGSPQLCHVSYADNLSSIATAALATPGIPSICAGDFNAHVAAALDQADSRGCALQQMCSNANSRICTGTLPGNKLAPSTRAGTGHTQFTRTDHVTANELALLLAGLVVNGGQQGSNHLPVELQLSVDLQCCCLAVSGLQRPQFLLCPTQRQLLPLAASALNARNSSAADAAGMPILCHARRPPGQALL